MTEKIVMLSDDTHIRTLLNKMIPGPCDFFMTPDDFLSIKGIYSPRNTIVFIDDRFQYRQALQICYKIQHKWPGMRIVILLKKDDEMPDTPIANGTITYLPKPLTPSGLAKAFRVNTICMDNEEAEVSYLVGDSDCMNKLRLKIRNIAAVLSNTIITGETGSGKELTLKELHRHSGKTLVTVNCSSLNSDIAESDLFGHIKGAYTSSTSERNGYIKRADGGILFLDEIENLSSQAQASMLRFLDSGEYYKVGGDVLNKADVIVIAATNEPLDMLLAEGRLRKDFYMRLAVNTLHVPPLREHPEDIPLLVRHKEKLMGYSTFIKDMDAAYSHNWTGNVRELFNVVQRAHRDCPENPAITADMLEVN